MTCGCQTIVANSEALIEVTDGNAILFDKLNHLDLSNKINVTLNHYNVVKFENKFSWNTMVYKTLKELL